MRVIFSKIAGYILLVAALISVNCSAQTVGSQRPSVADNGSIQKAPDLNAARAAHTATLLPDGRVLIAGGFVSEGIFLNDASIFDPKTNSFSRFATMKERRSSHTATLLPNGKVLIAGGLNGDYLDSAELFDPATNTFSSIGKMTMPRSGHVAVLLKNGKVLIAGGTGTGWTFLSSAEIFDPRTNSFSKTGDMTLTRESHTATLLPDGNVLITGGHSGRRSAMRVYSQSEIYNVAKGRFEAAGDMTIKRHKHEAVALEDGRVLIVGGSDETDGRGAYNSAEIYDSQKKTFTAINNMTRARYKLQGAVVRLKNGKVLIAGGTNDAEVYDPSTGNFSPVTGTLDDMKLFTTATLMPDGRVLIVGGYNLRVNVSASTWIVSL